MANVKILMLKKYFFILKVFGPIIRYHKKKNFLLSTLIVTVFIYTFSQFITLELHQNLQPTDRSFGGISIAISEMKYGLKGYTGYTKILKLFVVEIPASTVLWYQS